MAISGFLILLIVVLAIVALAAGGRHSEQVSRLSYRRDASRLQIWTRRLFPIVGLAIVAALILGTLQDIARVYDDAEVDDETLVASPSEDASARPSAEAGDPADSSLVVQTFLAERVGGGLRCLRARSTRLSYGATRLPALHYSGGGTTFQVSPGIEWVDHGDGIERIKLVGNYTFDSPGTSGSGGLGRTGRIGKPVVLLSKRLRPGSGSWLSLRSEPMRSIVGIAIVHRVAADEVLVDRSFHEVLESAGGVPEIGWLDPPRTGITTDMIGMSYFFHLGTASLPLLGACMLIVFYFRRRTFAMAGVLLAVVLVTSSVDRWMVGLHRDRLLDANASVASRCVAAEHLAETFFFGASATEAVGELIDDPSIPPSVREAATRTKRVLEESLVTR